MLFFKEVSTAIDLLLQKSKNSCAGPLKEWPRVSRASRNKDILERNSYFLFGDLPQREASSIHDSSQLCVTCISAIAAITSATTVPIQTSCIPIIIPLSPPIDILNDSAENFVSENHRYYSKAILSVSLFQMSIGVCEFLLGDVFSGIVTATLAAGGVYISTPHGVKWIPSVILISFLNGCLQSLVALEHLNNLGGMALFSGSTPLVVNFVHFAMIASPVASLMICYFGWNMLKEIRSTMLSVISQGVASGPSLVVEGGGAVRSDNCAGENFSPFEGSGYRLGEEPEVVE